MEQNNSDDKAPEEPDPFWSYDTPGETRPPGFWDHLTDNAEDQDEDPLVSTAPLPLPPEDRLWRHPSELRNTIGDLQDDRADLGRHRKGILVAAMSAGLAGAMAAGVAIWLLVPAREVLTERVIERHFIEPSAAFVKASVGGIDVVEIAQAVTPSIVRIELLNNFGSTVGSGSGVIFRDDGHVLTNAHVIGDSTRIEIIMWDGRRHTASLVGADSLTDIAVVKIRSDDLFPPVLMGSTAALQVGEPAIAVGSPLRLAGGPTVTVGIVSAVGRTLDIPGGGRLFDLVQTDAPISPGSSGGALLDSAGSLIGLTTVIAVSEVGAEGLGFATPVEIAYDVASDLVSDGAVQSRFSRYQWGRPRRFHGFAQLQLEGGALITVVGDGTPAAAAGLRDGDIVIAVDGVSVGSMGDLVVMIRRVDPGTTASITIVRDEDRIVLSADISARP